ncbi:hypothetical protein H6P81_000812 [Aristolochia fimbriata]|uniref:Uncharacterized protein n=1 Tax=Aristolochia fimbriata TaxID=158543 RepID=A0AAV7F6L1_ARIFI|nr:hypothetical protein H6P81_000812 [Aristolochia fimbriata]
MLGVTSGDVTLIFPSSGRVVCSKRSCWDFQLRSEIISLNMNKLLEFGRKALFVVRVLSGFEERRIRSYRLMLQKRIEAAEARKMALRKIPEQAILAEVRRMVEEMQTLNQKLEETESAIEDYFKPIDKQAEILMNTQLEREERTMKEMVIAMKDQALMEKEVAKRIANAHVVDASHNTTKDTPSTLTNESQVK